MVRYAVGLLPDSGLEESIRAIWQRLRDAGISSNLLDDRGRPHLSLAVCTGLPEDFETGFEMFARGIRSFPLSLQAAGTFSSDSGVVFLAPAVTADLTELHERFFDSFGSGLDGRSSLYSPGSWVPHCTVAMGLEPREICRAIGICADAGLPLEGSLVSAALLEFRESRVLSSKSWELGG
jgi:2'-5' RNA ligase